MVEGDDAAVLGRQLGRPGPAPARQLRGFPACGRQGQVAGGTRHRALDPLLYRLWPQAAARLLRLLPARQAEWLGQAAEGAAAGAPSGREIRRARRERVADQADEVDQALPAHDVGL